jgi:multiple sugar transport system permease protein
MPTVMLITIYKSFGFSMLIYIAAIHGVPRYLYEAAEIDGANSVDKFFHVTLPSIAPTITFTLITGMIASFQVFDQVFVTTKGGPLFRTETAVQLIYQRAFATYEMGRASANAFLLFLLILAVTIFVQRMRRNSESYF